MALQEQTCEVCGKVFTRPYRLKGGVFCSLACKKEKLDPVYTCEVCGIIIKQSPSLSQKKYCSVQCRKKASAQKRLNSGSVVSKSCKQCGQTFLIKTYMEEQYPKEFCTVKCKKIYHKVTLSCEHCGKEFGKLKTKVYPSQNQYCSLRCRLADTLITKTCKTCGKKYSGPQSKMRSNFCSHKCFEGPRTYVGLVALTCEHCGKEFQRYGSNLHIRHGAFCSKECRLEFRTPKRICGVCGNEYRSKKQYVKVNFCSKACKEKHTLETINCAYCQKPFEIYKSKGGKFCSSKCSGLSVKKVKIRTKSKKPAGKSSCTPTVLSAITGNSTNNYVAGQENIIG